MTATTEKTYIPEVAKEEIIRRAANIRAMKRDENGKLRFITHPDLFNTAYLWAPNLEGEAPPMQEVYRCTTYHTWAYYGFFKPSIAEVLAQLPADMVRKVKAFELVGEPQTAADFNKDREAFDAGYHVAEAVFYA